MKRSIVIWLALAALAGGNAPAATISVPGDQPTIAAAIGVAADGDVIDIGFGTWNEIIVLDADVAGFPLNLTLQGAGYWNTVWDAAQGGPCLQVTGTAAVSWHLADLAFTAGVNPAAVDIATAGGAWTVTDCRFYDSSTMIQHVSDLTVSGSLFVDSPTIGHTGIVSLGGSLNVTQSTFDNVYRGARVVATGASFSNCIFSNLQEAGLNFGGSVSWDCICEWQIAATGAGWPTGGNIIDADPQFCGAVGLRDWSLQIDSPCLDVQICGGLVGARGRGCGLVHTEDVGWGSLKAQYR